MFGDTVRELRLRLGLTQEQLAGKSGLGLRTIRDLETGRILRPRASTVAQLAGVFELRADDLTSFNEAALTSEPVEGGPDQPVPSQLPADVNGFTGRVEHLRQLTEHARGRASTVVISALSGTAGVGKTALAVHWAHRAASRFPDGQLFVNLRGFDPGGSVLTPAEALRVFLEALGVGVERIPAELDAQIALYRTLLTGKRMLILLDNARTADQVRPLLPGTGGSLVLITSRNQLAGLVAAQGAKPLTVNLLSTEESRRLLARRLGPARIAAEPESVDQLISACARLPLALAIVAARAAIEPEMPLRVLAEQLGAAAGTLDALAVDDPATDVRAVFSWSYRTLGAEAARLFRLLALHPGPDFGFASAASLAGRTEDQVQQLLAELCAAHLLIRPAPDRFAFHDLLRAYATERTETLDSADVRRDAVHRLLDHYLQTAYVAAHLMAPHRASYVPPTAVPGVTCDRLTDRQDALSWFAREHQGLLAAIGIAAADGLDDTVWLLAWMLVNYLDRRGHWSTWARLQRAALEAAGRLGNLAWQAESHRSLARAKLRLGLRDQARSEMEHAAELARGLGDHAGEAHARMDIIQVLDQEGRYDEALEQARRCLDLYRTACHAVGEAHALNSLAWLHVRLGNYPEALDAGHAAVARQRDLGDALGAAATWDTLGFAHHHLGQYRQAVDCYRQAVELQREVGDRHREAVVLTHLGDSHQAAGEPGPASQAWQHAVAILDELSHPDADQVRAKLTP